MAGFTINGFGASDKYYSHKKLGVKYCPCCKKTHMFSAGELKMKVRLLYIPTLTLNTKYAVLCDKCENGVYVEENDYLSLLDGKADISTESGEICLVRKNTDDKIYVEFSDNTDKAKENKSTIKNTEPNDLSSSHFTSASAFRHRNRSADSSVPGVSTKHSHVERPSSPTPQRVIKCCPKCKMLYTSSKEKCSFCSSDLVVRV